jgi:putative inorganic carbon (hco3(-)) transporter
MNTFINGKHQNEKMNYWKIPKKYNPISKALLILPIIGITGALVLSIISAASKLSTIASIAILALFVWKKKEYAFYLLLVIIPISLHFEPFIAKFPVPITDILAYLLILKWVTELISAKEIKFKKSRLNVPLIIFAILLAVSIIPSLPTISTHLQDKTSLITNTYELVTEGSNYVLYGLVMFIHMLVAIIMYFYILNNPIEKKKAIIALVIGYAIVTLYGVAESLLPTIKSISSHILSTSNTYYQTRITSTFRNPNVLGEYLALLTPLLIALTFYTKKIKTKIPLILLTLIGVVCLFLTASRGAWLGLIAGLVLFTILKTKLTNKNKLLTGAIAIVLLLIISAPVSYFILKERTINPSLAGRVPIWTNSLQMIKESPLHGYGIGSFIPEYEKNFPDAKNAQHAHNIFLNIAIESGLIVLAVLVWILFTLFIYPLKNKTNILNIGLYSGIFALLVHGLVEHVFFYQEITLLFFITLALTVKDEKDK